MELLTEAELKDLNDFFSMAKKSPLPKEILLSEGTTVLDVPRFIDHQFDLLQPDISPIVQKPALDRIRKLRELLVKRVDISTGPKM